MTLPLRGTSHIDARRSEALCSDAEQLAYWGGVAEAWTAEDLLSDFETCVHEGGIPAHDRDAATRGAWGPCEPTQPCELDASSEQPDYSL